jgi:hypothetical protein
MKKISRKRWLGVGVSVIGLIIISIAKFHRGSSDWGILILLIAVMAAGIYNVSQKPLLKTFHPIEVSAISAWCGTLCMCFLHPHSHTNCPMFPGERSVPLFIWLSFPAQLATAPGVLLWASQNLRQNYHWRFILCRYFQPWWDGQY